MNKSNLFNNESITIFTDSSFKKMTPKYSSESIGTTAPAILAYLGEELIYSNYNILHDSTTQIGELHAILMAVNVSYTLFNLYNVKYINIVSDSLSSVLAIRERLFRWFIDTKSEYKVRLGENGDVKNQNYILNIANTILANNLCLSIYHTRGHINIRNKNELNISLENFIKNNEVYVKGEPVDIDLITAISYYNDLVDRYSTKVLLDNLDSKSYIMPIEFMYNPNFNINNYMKLVY